jgi:endoglucanase
MNRQITKLLLLPLVLACTSCECPFHDELDRAQQRKSSTTTSNGNTGDVFYADKLLGTDRYRRYALQNVDYLLGRNATGYCFVTGFGDKSPAHPHHRPSEADGVEAPFPGMLVGGPNPGQQDKGDLGKAAYLSNMADESYIDAMESYASNEIAINWNASLVALLCWVDALKGEK